MSGLRLPHRVVEREGVNQEDGMSIPLIDPIIEIVDDGARLEANLHCGGR